MTNCINFVKILFFKATYDILRNFKRGFPQKIDVHSFEKEDFLKKLHILSCPTKKCCCLTFCVFDFFSSECWQPTLFQTFLILDTQSTVNFDHNIINYKGNTVHQATSQSLAHSAGKNSQLKQHKDTQQ